LSLSIFSGRFSEDFFKFYYQQEILRNIKQSRRQIAGDYSFKMRKNLGDHDDKTGKSATTLRTDGECSLTDAIHARARAHRIIHVVYCYACGWLAPSCPSIHKDHPCSRMRIPRSWPPRNHCIVPHCQLHRMSRL